MREVLHVGSLGTLQPGYLCLKEVVAPALLGVLCFETINLTRLGAELGLEKLDTTLADLCLGFQQAPHSIELICEIHCPGVGIYYHGATIARPPSTIALSVAAAD